MDVTPPHRGVWQWWQVGGVSTGKGLKPEPGSAPRRLRTFFKGIAGPELNICATVVQDCVIVCATMNNDHSSGLHFAEDQRQL